MAQAQAVIERRIAQYREIGTAYKHINDQLKSKAVDVGVIVDSVQVIKTRGAEMSRWFPPGSEPPAEPTKSLLERILNWFTSSDSVLLPEEMTSHAKSAVWTDRPGFERAHERFSTEADRMWMTARAGQVSAIRSQFERLGATCKACHDTYRAKLD